MKFEVIHNPAFSQAPGFSQAQFRKLDQIYCAAAASGVIPYRTVDCDFDEGVASYTYYQAEGQSPYLCFVIRKAGPRAMMYELYKRGKGRIAKSGIFERTLETLRQEVDLLCPSDC